MTEVERNLTKKTHTIYVNDNENGNKDPSDRVQMVDSLANEGPPGPTREIQRPKDYENLV